MKCERCKKAEATIHLTQMLNGEVKKLNLCQNCAKETGINLNAPISITDILMGLGIQSSTEEAPSSPEFDLSCSRCSMTRTEFKKHGRLGCPECYNAFMGELGALAKAMHHSNQHVGKIPACQGQHARMMAQIAALQKDIETAITKEEYEIAARLRDQIKQLQEDAAQLKGAGVEP
jgi:protein arginine kinase activator